MLRYSSTFSYSFDSSRAKFLIHSLLGFELDFSVFLDSSASAGSDFAIKRSPVLMSELKFELLLNIDSTSSESASATLTELK